MPRTGFLVALSGLVLAAAACSAAPAATNTPAPATSTPIFATATPTTAPTAAVATATAALPTAAGTPAPTTAPVGVGTECSGKPTFSVASPAAPSFAPDPAIDALWPAQIDGQPVTQIQSASWLATICFYAGQAEVDKLKQASASAALLATLTFGSAHATVGGNDVTMSAFRVPGSDANAIIQNASLFVTALTGATPEPFTTTQATIGGKQVSVLTDSTGKITYAYPKGDIAVTLDNVDATTAATIFAALP